jgi:hypothetical protein
MFRKITQLSKSMNKNFMKMIIQNKEVYIIFTFIGVFDLRMGISNPDQKC